MWIVNKLLWLLLLWGGFAVNLYAQQMEVKDFRKLSRPWLGKRSYSIDKKSATLDFFTEEEGFTFLADAKIPVEPQAGEGCITLLLPHKTRFVQVDHPKHGTLVWKVPKKYLKRKKHYQAVLQVCSADEEFRLKEQWVVFRISPRNAMVRVDSTLVSTRNGEASFYLPLGKHPYKVESPFYRAVEDSFSLDETARKVIELELQPVYSYLTVSAPWEEAEILVDGNRIGSGEATSGRLMAGNHRVEVIHDSGLACCRYVSLGEVEKKHVVFVAEDFSVPDRKVIFAAEENRIADSISSDSAVVSSVVPVDDSVRLAASVRIMAPAPDISILLNREVIGTGEWQGELPFGDYALQTRKDSLESTVTWLSVRDNRMKEINLAVPQIAYGMLNIQSNVADAEIWINGEKRGYTPCVIKQLPSGIPCKVTLRKSGYREVSEYAVPPRNSIMDITIRLKKK